MNSDEDLGDLFEEHESRENEGANEMEVNEESNKEKVQPPKRIVKNPRLKFNPERLCGERGIPILVDHFKDVKFKGKGYEKEDLDKLLLKLEHWTHRLFPSMKFEDCVHHIEKLGKKRPVQTCLRKIRLDMPILDGDFVKDNEEDDVQKNKNENPVEMDAFDRLVGEDRSCNPITTVDTDRDSFTTFSSSVQRIPTSESEGQVLGSSVSTVLTEEQKERLERNRMLAIERRKAKLALAQQNPSESSLENNRTSREDSSTLDSPAKNRFNDLLTNNSHSHNDKNEQIFLSDSNNQNSDNLVFDDLIDLVNTEEHDSNNITHSSSEHSQNDKSPNLKAAMSCSTLNNNNSNMAVTLNTLESTEDKNLEFDSLVDLINDNSEECQQHSDSLATLKYDKTDNHNKNLICGEEMSSAMDCEHKDFDSDSSALVIDEDA